MFKNLIAGEWVAGPRASRNLCLATLPPALLLLAFGLLSSDLAAIYPGRLLLGFCPTEQAPAARGHDRGHCSIASVEGWLDRAGFGSIEGGVEWDGGRPLAWITARA